ncbi:MAG: hypothetical protein LBG65_07595 [Puniceicoccales bacterium]|jgi:hypothetical protein|nr:hypothetical protein [Puniceicoccales bacterium]
MAAKNQIIWHGKTSGLTEQAECEISRRGDGEGTTITLVGTWEDCLANAPVPGNTIQPYKGIVVPPVTIRRTAGGKGTITVKMDTHPESGDKEGEPLGEPQYETDYATAEQPLSCSPRYNEESQFGATMSTPLNFACSEPPKGWAGDKTAAREALKDIFSGAKTWEGTVAQLIEVYKNLKLGEKVLVATLMGNAAADRLMYDYFELYDKGTDCIRNSVPVLRKTTQLTGPVTPGRIDVQQTPQGFKKLPKTKSGKSFVWVKTADRQGFGQRGPCQRTEEWSGFDHVDERVFPKG